MSRLNSMIATSQIAEAVMNFVIKLSKNHHSPYYDEVVKFLPRALDFLSHTPDKVKTDFDFLKKGLSNSLKEKFVQMTGNKNA